MMQHPGNSGAHPGSSIGTLTGWQLLADQVVGARNNSDDGGSESDTSSSSGLASPTSPRAGASDARRRSRSRHRTGGGAAAATAAAAAAAGGAPALSAGRRSGSGALASTSDSAAGMVSSEGVAAFVAPRPHQWLYREYRLLEEIGSGGFGRVCKARRLADGKLVVVKEIKTSCLTPKQKAATMEEVEVLAKLDHPLIVQYRECFADELYINIVMEYCDAGDLTGAIKARQGLLMTEDEVMAKFVQICLALQHVHARGILHRDLKPSNVLATSPGLLKIGDFGVSKRAGDASMASTVVGTPHYLSPEMCSSESYGRKSDVWALGCVLVELATLSKAFDGTSMSRIILDILKGAHRTVPETYSPGLRDLATALLRVAPGERPSAAEVLRSDYVKPHLWRFLERARFIPDARIEVLVSTLQRARIDRPPQLSPVFAGAPAGAAVVPTANLQRLQQATAPLRAAWRGEGPSGSGGSAVSSASARTSGNESAVGAAATAAAATAAAAGAPRHARQHSGGGGNGGAAALQAQLSGVSAMSSGPNCGVFKRYWTIDVSGRRDAGSGGVLLASQLAALGITAPPGGRGIEPLGPGGLAEEQREGLRRLRALRQRLRFASGVDGGGQAWAAVFSGAAPGGSGSSHSSGVGGGPAPLSSGGSGGTAASPLSDGPSGGSSVAPVGPPAVVAGAQGP